MTEGKINRIGPKGQVVLKKSLRDKLGMKEGTLVEERLMGKGILIQPFQADRLLQELKEVSRNVSRRWPKGLDSVEAIRRERR